MHLGKHRLGLGGVEVEDGDVGLVPHELHLGDEETVGAVVQALLLVLWVGDGGGVVGRMGWECWECWGCGV